MKTLFEKHVGEVAMLTLETQFHAEGVIRTIEDEYLKLETSSSGDDKFIYIRIASIIHAWFRANS